MSPAGVETVAVPDIGDFSDVPIIEILVSPGDEVSEDDPLVTLESDKATMDVPAPFAGTVRELQVDVGDKVSEGTQLLTIEPSSDGASSSDGARSSEKEDSSEGSATSSEQEDSSEGSATSSEQDETSEGSAAGSEQDETTESSAAGSEQQQTSEAPAAQSDGSSNGAPRETPSPETMQQQPQTEDGDAPPTGRGSIYASPSVRRLARERDIDLSQIKGSGRKGRITREDLESSEAAPQERPAPAGGDGAGLELAPWPSVNFEKFGPVERAERSRIQKISAPNLARNWVMIPHVTHNDEADITDLEEWRKALNEEQARSGDGVKVTMVSFLVIASVVTLKAFPNFNSSLDGEELVLKRYYNIGFAADTPGGLVVPVIKDADSKGLFEIARDLTTLSGKAREGKLTSGEMSGASFTISSLGGIGGTSFTPIINAPEVAILGATRSAIKPVWNGSEFGPRLMLPLSLSYDHRVIDGATAARFTAHLVKVLSDLRRALL